MSEEKKNEVESAMDIEDEFDESKKDDKKIQLTVAGRILFINYFWLISAVRYLFQYFIYYEGYWAESAKIPSSCH